MTLRQRIVRKVVRMTMPFRYEWIEPVVCWCHGALNSSWHAAVGECWHCGTGVLRRRLTESAYRRWYASGDYRRWVMGTTGVSVHQLVKEIRRSAAGVDFLRRTLVSVHQHSLMDVGCGAGGWLAVAHLLGAYPILGVDVDPRSHIVPEQFGISVVAEIPMGTRYDRIICSHLLEHIVQPVEFLERLSSHLTPDGCIYVETPEWGPKADVKLPHVYYFTQDSMRLLATRAGFDVMAMGPGLRAVLRRVQ